MYIYVTVLKLKKYGIELYTSTKETDTRHQYFWVGHFYATAGVSSETLLQLATCKTQRFLASFRWVFNQYRWFSGGNISYHQNIKISQNLTQKKQKIFQQKGGVSGFHHFFLQVTARWWTSCWLQEPRPACVLPMLRSKGRHRNKPPSWRRPQNGPQKGLFRKSPDDREASTRYVRENVAWVTF